MQQEELPENEELQQEELPENEELQQEELQELEEEEIPEQQSPSITLPMWWRNPFFRIPRNLNLQLQAYIRKYLKIPVLIVLKNSARWFLFQPSEWENDWSEFKQERYINKNALLMEVFLMKEEKEPGKEETIISKRKKTLFEETKDGIYETKRQNRWINQGFQVEVVSPFCLRPWHSPASEPKSNFYLTGLGGETQFPFGKNQIQHAFWKPVWKVFAVKISYRAHKVRHQGLTLCAKIIKLVLPLVHFIKQNLLVLKKVFNAIAIIIKNYEIRNQLKQKDSETPLLSQQSSQLQNKNTLQTDQITSTNKHSFIVSNLIDSVDSNKLLNLKRNLIKKREHIQHTLIQIEHISELFKTQNSIDPNKLVQISLSKSLFVARNVNKNTRFQIQTISEPSFKSFKYKHLILKSKLLHLKQEYTQINVQINQLNTQWFNFLNKPYLLFNIDLSYKYAQRFILISRYFTDMVRSWFHESNMWIHNMNIESIMKRNKKISINTSTHIFANVLSQAHVLHKIWETNTRIKMSISSVTNNLGLNHSFESNEHELLLAKGILTTQTPEMLTKNTWNRLIKDFPQYIPSPKLWIDIVPQKWIHQIQTHWDATPRFEHQKSENKLFESHQLESHQQSVKKAQKLFTQWKCYLVARTYTSLIQYKIPYSLVRSDTFTNQILENYVLNKSSLFEILNNQDILVNKEKTVPSITLETEETDLSPKETDPSPKETDLSPKETDPSPKETDLSPKETDPLLIETDPSPKETALSPKETDPLLIETDPSPKETDPSPKKTALSPKETDRLLIGTDPLLIDDRIITYNLVSSYLRSAEESNLFPRLSLIIENMWLFNKSREFRLLEFLNLETEMHNLENIEPLSKKENNLLEQKEINTKNILANSLYTNDSKFRMSYKESGSIKESRRKEARRFLWPIHRLEDLACINRFWIGSGDQSRLNTLRIKMYPFVLS